MPTTVQHNNQARALWSWCLVSALRTALASTIVGWITLYGPALIQRQIAFPAFSYVTVILIVTDATLGDTLHACWLALYATVQTVGPAILSLWLIGPARFTIGASSLAVAVASFAVALPEGTHLIAKRIALGQIVLLYVITCIHGPRTDVVMHPLRLAASTAVGVFACILALLLPFPRLACWEVEQNCKLLAENASERLKLYVKAFCTVDNAVAMASTSQAKPLAIAETKLLQNIKRYQGNMKWETFPFRFWRSYDMNPAERFQALEMALRGMEMALTSIPSFPVRILDGGNKEVLVQLEDNITQTIKKIKNFSPSVSLTFPEAKGETIIESLQTLQTVSTNHQDLPSFFFLFCMKLLGCNSLPKPTTSSQENEGSTPTNKQKRLFKAGWSNFSMNASTKRLMPAFKCSVSLGLAVLFGMIYSKENGYWSGLPVAISMASAREATFKVANVKAQGTVLGTIYGVIACFVFERYVQIRFLSLLPWFIVASFLRRSRMYGQAGGISAVIGALLILGRKNFGPPSEFAIVRIVETFIGLSCSIIVELLMQPTRASSLAKVQLSKTLSTLHACFASISLGPNRANLVENQIKLKSDVSELKKFIGEAEAEPNFRFIPFGSACYNKLQASTSNMMDLLLFSAHAVGLLEAESRRVGGNSWKEYAKKLDRDIQLFKERIGSLVKCLEDITLLESLKGLEKELEKKKLSSDPECGKCPRPNIFSVSGTGGQDEAEKIMNSYLQHSKEWVDKLQEAEDGEEKEVKRRMVLSLSAIGFCMINLTKEAREIEKGIHELVQWENPCNQVNLYDITCKIRSLHS